MPIMAALIPAGASLLGGLFSGNAAKSAASTQANAQLEAARVAADAAKFRPVGVTTAFGTSQFGKDAQGNVTSAGYTLSPEMAAQRDLLMKQMGTSGMGLAGQAAAGGQSLFNLGQQFIPTGTGYSASPESQQYAQQLRGLSGQIIPQSYDTTAAAQQYMQQQQGLLQPGRERSYAQLQQNLQNTGRGGFSVAQGGSLGAANPEAQAYYNAIAQQDAMLAANAQQQARSNLQGDITFGTGLAGTALTSQQRAEEIARQNMLGNIQAGQGLMGAGIDLTSAGYNPYKTQLGLAQNLESTGQNALDIGTALGGRVTAANTAAGGLLGTGMTNAAATMAPANAYSPWGASIAGLANNQALMSGVSNWLTPQATPTNMSGFQTPYTAPTYQPPMAALGTGMWNP